MGTGPAGGQRARASPPATAKSRHVLPEEDKPHLSPFLLLSQRRSMPSHSLLGRGRRGWGLRDPLQRGAGCWVMGDGSWLPSLQLLHEKLATALFLLKGIIILRYFPVNNPLFTLSFNFCLCNPSQCPPGWTRGGDTPCRWPRRSRVAAGRTLHGQGNAV